jgi:DNA-directed RNA polymerase subunit M/transcription elongation factor TFIIS
MNNPTRQFVVERFSSLLEIPVDDILCINLEKNILNYACDTNTCGDPAWDNPDFVKMYKMKFLSLQSTIRRFPHLKDVIVNKKVTTKEIVNMRPDQLWPDGPYDTMMRERLHNEIRKEYLSKENKNHEGLFTCGRCKSKKTTYYEMQTRSADEPMTVFVSCLNCDKNWKC